MIARASSKKQAFSRSRRVPTRQQVVAASIWSVVPAGIGPWLALRMAAAMQMHFVHADHAVDGDDIYRMLPWH